MKINMSKITKEVKNRIQRFSTIEWAEPAVNTPVLIVGAGGIGSYLALWLSRMQLQITLMDNDVIDETNMSGQHYNTDDIGKPKVEAIAEQIENFSNCEVRAINGLFDENTPTFPIMFSAVDNMKTRKTMFDAWKKRKDREVFIDGRMTAENIQVYIVTKGREKEYEKHLFSDEEVPDLLCTARATTHCGAMIASLMTAGFTNYITNRTMKKQFRETPLKLEYFLELFVQKVEV